MPLVRIRQGIPRAVVGEEHDRGFGFPLENRVDCFEEAGI